MKIKLLVVENETDILKKYQLWLKKEFEVDGVSATLDAENRLREKRYNVVLLDLNMDIGDNTTRENRGIQEYLASHPEGTQCIVVTGLANTGEEAREILRIYNAVDIMYKQQFDLAYLKELINKAYQQSVINDKELKAKSRNLIFSDAKGSALTILENELLTSLKPKGGMTGLNQVFEVVIDKVYPIVPHSDGERRYLEKSDGCILGLFWSRQLGGAVSIAVFKKDLGENDVYQKLDDWLNWKHGEVVYQKEIANVQIGIFKETGIESRHFNLPEIPTA